MVRILIAILMCLVVASPAQSETTVRVATYNIKFLSTNVTQQGDRLQKLLEVIELLDADVIGLQEIDDRAALELIFPPAQWHIVIDDDSGENQDVALVVRRPFGVLDIDSDLDADDRHFLFSGSQNNTHFPDRRDLLTIQIQIPTENETFFVMVHHAKSRYGGRANNDSRRVGASRDILQVLERDFDDRHFILLGDFNDNPDDQSLNILEIGDPAAPAGPEEIAGLFLINLTEPLCVDGHVSHGRNTLDIVNGQINTIDPDSRQRNNVARGTNQNTGDILFDQILIPSRMRERYVQGSIQVFNLEVGVRGNRTTRASDHLPVFSEFVFGIDAPEGNETGNLRILSLLPNPNGTDRGNEQVTIRNLTDNAVDLNGWKLRDRAGNEFLLSGIVPANGTHIITMSTFSMPLNNSGDDVLLIDPQGHTRHHVSYSASEAGSGLVVSFN